jgi:hypothetical protein
MASEVLMTISRDEVERARLQSELKYKLDKQSWETQGLKRSARNMKADGVSTEQIAKWTGLTVEQIEKL